MKITQGIFYIIFLIIILNINISSAKEITIKKITTIEMDYSSFNISTQYESVDAPILDFFSDAFTGINNKTLYDINYSGPWIKPYDFRTTEKPEGAQSNVYYFHIIAEDVQNGLNPILCTTS